MESQIISKENIKPSSPTPHHLRIHKLSLFDQLVPPIFVPLVLYFPGAENSNHSINNPEFISKTTQILKQSLSDTLARFYPLAGRVRDLLSIDCNDEGMPFAVVKINGSLKDFLKNPNPVETRAHIPSQLTWDDPSPGSHVAMTQVNYFDCGGMALGSIFLHKVIDGVTIGSFMKAWSTSARAGSKEMEFPNYVLPSFFPQNEEMKREAHLYSAMRQYFAFRKTVTRRYVFDSMAISKLRAKLSSPDHEGNKGVQFRPSRVETVSALIWKCFISASLNVNKSNPKVTLVTHGVNMRRKAEPAFPEGSFGNCVWLVPASSSPINNQTTEIDMKNLVCKVRTAINKVDDDFIKRMEGKDGFSGYLENLEEAWDEFPENADYLPISSWCNFGLYGVDFGWGSPVWMTKCDAGSDVEMPFLNVCWLMDTKQGDGIEAWVTLDERYTAAFEAVHELQALASIDPSPIDGDA